MGMIIVMAAYSSSALAQSAAINPRCAKMGKPKQCTCALETGGVIEPNGRWRYYNSPAYAACMARNKWM